MPIENVHCRIGYPVEHSVSFPESLVRFVTGLENQLRSQKAKTMHLSYALVYFPDTAKEKKPQKPMYTFGNFSAFFLWSPPLKLKVV